MSTDPVLERTRAVIERVVGPGRIPAESGAGTRLVDEYWLDSVELLEVLVTCEAEFGVVFEESRDFENGSLETLGSLVALIRERQAASGRP